MKKSMLSTLACSLLVGSGSLWPVVLTAQAEQSHAEAHMAEHGDLPPETIEQIERVEAAVHRVATTSAAAAAGFEPRLGLIPTMGTHWVSRRRMFTRGGLDLDRPEHLMFAPIDGEQTLVGVAYAFFKDETDDELPDAFPGELDQWHVHPELSPPGRELTMLHVWFVPSPDGPFAGHNPWLPYMAVGLEAPDPVRLGEPDDSYRLRALALALAETVAPLGPAEALERFGDRFASEEVEGRREAIAALIPALKAAEEGGDTAAWNEVADDAIAHWENIRQAYLDAIPLPLIREQLSAFYGEMLTGAHDAHDANDAEANGGHQH